MLEGNIDERPSEHGRRLGQVPDGAADQAAGEHERVRGVDKRADFVDGHALRADQPESRREPRLFGESDASIGRSSPAQDETDDIAEVRDVAQRDRGRELHRLESEEHLGVFEAEALADPVAVEVFAPRPAAHVSARGADRIERSRVFENGAGDVRCARRYVAQWPRIEKAVGRDRVRGHVGAAVVVLERDVSRTVVGHHLADRGPAWTGGRAWTDDQVVGDAVRPVVARAHLEEVLLADVDARARGKLVDAFGGEGRPTAAVAAARREQQACRRAGHSAQAFAGQPHRHRPPLRTAALEWKARADRVHIVTLTGSASLVAP